MTSLVKPSGIRSILVATDLTERSDAAVRAGAALAALTGARLHLLHSFDLQPLPRGREVSATFPERIAQAEALLADQVRRCVPSGVKVVSQRVVLYVAHKAILARAAAVRADVIVLGRHRARPADRFLGTTADRVLRGAAVPCLVVQGELALPLRRVVAATDFSPAARAALEHAAEWAADLGPGPSAGPAELRVLHVIPRSAEVAGGLAEAAQAALAREARRLAALAGSRVEVRPVLRAGEPPAAEILEYATEERPNLLVLGTHGRGAVARALLGSVASAVARAAPCPTLLVPPALWRAGGGGGERAGRTSPAGRGAARRGRASRGTRARVRGSRRG